jgi:hypothetical protein
MSHTIAPLGAALALVLAPSAALAASNASVTVRVEGKSKTLLAPTSVKPATGSVTHDGAPKGDCSADSAAGVLDAVTHHRWSGTFESKYGDYLISGILGEKHPATASSKYYWSVFANHVAATTGACGVKLHRGEQLLFAVVPTSDAGDFPLAITGAPRSATTGHAFTVTVVYYDAKGKAHPLSGARITGEGVAAVTTDKAGHASITATRAGRLVLSVQHAGYVRQKEHFGYVRAESAPVSVA